MIETVAPETPSFVLLMSRSLTPSEEGPPLLWLDEYIKRIGNSVNKDMFCLMYIILCTCVG